MCSSSSSSTAQTATADKWQVLPVQRPACICTRSTLHSLSQQGDAKGEHPPVYSCCHSQRQPEQAVSAWPGIILETCICCTGAAPCELPRPPRARATRSPACLTRAPARPSWSWDSADLSWPTQCSASVAACRPGVWGPGCLRDGLSAPDCEDKGMAVHMHVCSASTQAQMSLGSATCMSISCVSLRRGTCFRTAPVRCAASCHGTMFAWCSATDTRICRPRAVRVVPVLTSRLSGGLHTLSTSLPPGDSTGETL